MTGIVRPRRDLVDQHLTVGIDEHLHRQQADQVERGRDGARNGLGLLDDGIRHAGRGQRQIQNVVAMAVLNGIERTQAAIRATGDDDTDLLGEVDEPLQDQRLRRQVREGGRQLVGLMQRALALAVIALARGLQHRRKAELGGGRAQLIERPDRAPRRGRHTDAIDEALFGDAILADA